MLRNFPSFVLVSILLGTRLKQHCLNPIVIAFMTIQIFYNVWGILTMVSSGRVFVTCCLLDCTTKPFLMGIYCNKKQIHFFNPIAIRKVKTLSAVGLRVPPPTCGKGTQN